MKLVACYSVYNNIDFLAASIKSIEKYVDRIIIVDGRYSQYPAYNGKDWSLDGTQYARNFSDKIEFVQCTQAYNSQMEKRNVYLSMVQPGDWVFVIDGDEILFGDMSKLKDYMKDKEVIHVVRYHDHTTSHTATKLFKMKPGLRYVDYHWKLIDPANPDINIMYPEKPKSHPFPDFFILNMKLQRADWILAAKEEFRRNRNPVEYPKILQDLQNQANKKITKKTKAASAK